MCITVCISNFQDSGSYESFVYVSPLRSLNHTLRNSVGWGQTRWQKNHSPSLRVQGDRNPGLNTYFQGDRNHCLKACFRFQGDTNDSLNSCFQGDRSSRLDVWLPHRHIVQSQRNKHLTHTQLLLCYKKEENNKTVMKRPLFMFFTLFTVISIYTSVVTGNGVSNYYEHVGTNEPLCNTKCVSYKNNTAIGMSVMYVWEFLHHSYTKLWQGGGKPLIGTAAHSPDTKAHCGEGATYWNSCRFVYISRWINYVAFLTENGWRGFILINENPECRKWAHV